MFVVGCDDSAKYNGEWTGKADFGNPMQNMRSAGQTMALTIGDKSITMQGEEIQISGKSVVEKDGAKTLNITNEDRTLEFKIMSDNELLLGASQNMLIKFTRDQ